MARNRGEFALGELHSTPHFGRSVNWRKIVAITPTTRSTAKGRFAWAVSPKVKTRSGGCTVFLTPVQNLDNSECSKQSGPDAKVVGGTAAPAFDSQKGPP